MAAASMGVLRSVCSILELALPATASMLKPAVLQGAYIRDADLSFGSPHDSASTPLCTGRCENELNFFRQGSCRSIMILAPYREISIRVQLRRSLPTPESIQAGNCTGFRTDLRRSLNEAAACVTA